MKTTLHNGMMAMTEGEKSLYMKLGERSEWLAVLESSIVIFLNVFSFTGNLLVCLAVYNNRRLRTIPNMFVVALAISDILVSVLTMPFTAAILMAGRWLFDQKHQFCLFMGFCLFQCGVASLLMMCQVAVNRYFCVVKPNLYRKIYKKRNTLILIILTWVLALAASIPPLLMKKGKYVFQPGKGQCLFAFETNVAFTIFLDVFYIATNMTIIAYCYFKVYQTVTSSNKRFRPNNKNMSKEEKKQLAANVEEAKVTKTLAGVVFAFACCWLPIGVIDTIDVFQGDTLLPRQLYLTYGYLVFISSTVNPFIYGILSPTFRREYRRIVCGKTRFVSTGNESTSSDTGRTDKVSKETQKTEMSTPHTAWK